MELIKKYFPNLTDIQYEQLAQLKPLYEEWNQKINVISRKDMDAFYEHHVLHSLAIARYIGFVDGTKIMDVGTGGGFPGIPLAIVFPKVQFHLVDSIGKKIKVVNAVAESLGLKNVTATHGRAEKVKDTFDFVVSRAVTAFPPFVNWVRNKISPKVKNAIPNGILYLKGGNFQEEVKPFGKRVTLIELPDYFEESFFETKKIIHLALV